MKEILDDPVKHEEFLNQFREKYNINRLNPEWMQNKREYALNYYYKKAEDPQWVKEQTDKKRERDKQRGRRIISANQKERIKILNLRAVVVSKILTNRGFDMTGIESHHWNYEYLKSVFLLPKSLHKFLHRYLYTNLEDKHLYVKKGNVRIETPEQAADIFADILAKRNYYEPLKLVDFSKDETTITEYSKWSQADV